MPRKPLPDVTIEDLLKPDSGLHAFTTTRELDSLLNSTPNTPQTGPTPDPLADVEYTGNTEIDAKTELTALQKAFRIRRKDGAARQRDPADTGYWVAIYFTTIKEKDEYLEEFGLADIGTQYLDGHRVTKAMRRLIRRT